MTSSDIPHCLDCGQPVTRKRIPFHHAGIHLGDFDADGCEHGHDYFTQDASREIERIAKEHGVWGQP